MQAAVNSDADVVTLFEQLEADEKLGPLYTDLVRKWFGPKLIRNPEFQTKLAQKFDHDGKLTKALIKTQAGASVILEDNLFKWIRADIARYDETGQRGYYAALRKAEAGVAADLIGAVRNSRGNASGRSFAPLQQYIRTAENKRGAGAFKCKVEGCPSKTGGWATFQGLIVHAGKDHPTLPRPVRADYLEELEAGPKRGTRPKCARGATRSVSG